LLTVQTASNLHNRHAQKFPLAHLRIYRKSIDSRSAEPHIDWFLRRLDDHARSSAIGPGYCRQDDDVIPTVGLDCSGYFTILISMSRLIAIKFTGLHRKIGLKHANFVSFLVWLVVLCLACYTAFNDTKKAYGIIWPRLFTLGIDLRDDYSQFLSYYNFCHNVTCCLVVIVINTVTYFYVKSSRNRVVSLQQSQVNKLEIKLYFQCVTVSAILTVLWIIYGVGAFSFPLDLVSCVWRYFLPDD